MRGVCEVTFPRAVVIFYFALLCIGFVGYVSFLCIGEYPRKRDDIHGYHDVINMLFCAVAAIAFYKLLWP